METVKRISLVLILILCMCSLSKTYATINCNVEITAPQEVTQGETITVIVGINNIQGEKGVLVLGGVIEYNKNLLTLTNRSSANGWSLSYNETTGQFVADRDGFAKNNENVFTLTFTANTTGNANITIKNPVVTDAIDEITIRNASKSISIKAKSQTINPGDNQGGNKPGDNQGGNSGDNNQGGSSNPGNNSQGGSSNPGGNKPQGGNNNQGTTSGNNQGNDNQTSGTNEEQNTTQETNTVTGIDQNRVNEENKVNNKPNIVEKNDEPTDYEEVKLHKQTGTTIIIYIVCAVGVIAIGIIILIGKKMMSKAR